MNQLPISPRTVLIDLNAVRASRGINTWKILELTESGGLIFVFNLAAKHDMRHRHNLRFWVNEIVDGGATAHLSIEEAIARILPANRKTINGSELAQWLMISKQTVMRIGKQLKGALKNRMLFVQRDPLAEWLQSRWLGSIHAERSHR